MLKQRSVVKSWCEKTLVAFVVACMVCGSAGAADTQGPSEAELEAKIDDARQRLEAAAEELARLSSQRATDGVAFFAAGVRRPLLGIVPAPDAKGVRVLNVLPGSAAEAAALQRGDLITHIGGVDLGGQHNPLATLSQRLAKAAFGDEMAITLEREGNVVEVTATLKKHELPPHAALGMEFEGIEGAPFDVAVAAPMVGFAGAHWLPLNESLGRYFGVDKGVLIAQGASTLDAQLQDGDVITAVNGKAVNDPGDLMRELHAGHEGELTREVELMRDRGSMTLVIKTNGMPGMQRAFRWHKGGGENAEVQIEVIEQD